MSSSWCRVLPVSLKRLGHDEQVPVLEGGGAHPEGGAAGLGGRCREVRHLGAISGRREPGDGRRAAGACRPCRPGRPGSSAPLTTAPAGGRTSTAPNWKALEGRPASSGAAGTAAAPARRRTGRRRRKRAASPLLSRCSMFWCEAARAAGRPAGRGTTAALSRWPRRRSPAPTRAMTPMATSSRVRSDIASVRSRLAEGVADQPHGVDDGGPAASSFLRR